MTLSRPYLFVWLALALLSPLFAHAAEKGVWSDPNDTTLGPEFKLHGEYRGEHIGAQVIALGNNALQVVVLPGGLPGDGWDGANKSLVDGKIDGDKAALSPAKGNKKYLAHSPAEFSATSKNPPEGQKDYSGSIADGKLTLTTDDGKTLELKRVIRTSPTLGAKPPEGAVVLFDGTSTDAWDTARLDPEAKTLNNTGKDMRTKQKFDNYTAHVEFMLIYKPDGRDQGRSNSGFYQVDQYELQILDSFGLDGKDNECGGIYTKLSPKVNMCYPPLQWQTYDVDFTNAVATDGKKSKNARITVKHNGVVIHDDAEINGKTGGARGEPEGTPGKLQLQAHGNAVQFRNIWVEEHK